MVREKLSVIFPTRERPKLLGNILRSIAFTTHNPDNVEVLIAYDDDDSVTKMALPEMKAIPRLNLVPVECKRSMNFSRDYYSKLAKIGKGDWFVVVNDDADFRTMNWDCLTRDALNAAIKDGPNIIYGWVEDNLGKNRLTQFNNYTCFPILGRAGVEKLGYIFPETIPTWGADIWAYYLYNRINRIAKVPITISHISHHNGTREQDAINKRIEQSCRGQAIQMYPTREELHALDEALGARP